MFRESTTYSWRTNMYFNVINQLVGLLMSNSEYCDKLEVKTKCFRELDHVPGTKADKIVLFYSILFYIFCPLFAASLSNIFSE